MGKLAVPQVSGIAPDPDQRIGVTVLNAARPGTMAVRLVAECPGLVAGATWMFRNDAVEGCEVVEELAYAQLGNLVSELASRVRCLADD